MAKVVWWPVMLALVAGALYNNHRIYTNDKDILELQKHLHYRPSSQGNTNRYTGLPVNNIDKKLIQPLDGIRGWY